MLHCRVALPAVRQSPRPVLIVAGGEQKREYVSCVLWGSTPPFSLGRSGPMTCGTMWLCGALTKIAQEPLFRE